MTASRILLVDDHPANLRLLTAILEPFGYDTLQATSGGTALALLEQGGIDLVLLDVEMPGLDGLGVLRILRAREQGAHVPVVIVTAHADREIRLRGLNAGADEFLEKPIDDAVLVARVSGLLKLKHAQDELRSRHAALERLERERQELTQFLVHDLKNPIAVVSANLDYIAESVAESDHEVQAAVRDARDANARITAMVQDMLTIASLEQSQVSLRIERIDVAELLDEVYRTQVRNAESRGISVQLAAEKGTEVNGDRALLRRVLENLADNALRYTPRGGSVGFICHRGDPIEMGVANTGAPIPTEIRGKIFEKFFRGQGAGLLNAGLGLNFCHQVVAAHGGDIRVTDTPEWPTLFSIALPRVPRLTVRPPA